MAPTKRRSSAIARKIKTLQLRLAPLIPLPSGPPHPAFPKTLMAFHLLTEEELDSIAHYYHQSTPGPFTRHYPAPMNWDKEFLAKSELHTSSTPFTPGGGRRRPNSQGQGWLEDLTSLIQQKPTATLISQAGMEEIGISGDGPNPYASLSDKKRIEIKRRKVGKFIGLVGMETPAEEIVGRIQASLDRAIEIGREDLRRNEEYMMRWRKVG